MNFKAAMFDFDGTITEKGLYAPPLELAAALVDLSQKIPIGFCTGRQLESFEEHGLTEFIKEIDANERQPFFENLFLLAENGAIGYSFDTNLDVFEQFYRVEWPNSFISRDVLKKELREAISEYGDVYDDAHRVVVVMRTKLHDFDGRDVEEVYRLAEEIYKVALGVLQKLSPDFEKYLHIGNSGIGVVISPADGDKDEGIKRFGEFLMETRGVKFGADFREILVVGDNPQKGGNDHYFLSGKYGTPYNVGDFDLENPLLKIVVDKNGRKLVHAGGTLQLVKSVLKNFS